MFKLRLQKLQDMTIKRKIVVLMFMLVTITPTVLVGVLATVYYHLGIETLFNEKISKSLAETVKVAELYLREHRDSIKIDLMRIANDIDENHYQFIENPKLLEFFTETRGLTEAMVFTNDGIVAKTRLSFSLIFEKLPEEAIVKANSGEVAILANDSEHRVRAIIRLRKFIVPTYLLVGRYVDPNILNHLRNSQGSASQYESLLNEIKLTQLKLGLIFLIVSALLCISAIIIGLTFARRLAKPINKLLQATALIQEGDFSVRVPERETKDEIAVLSRAFNRMTEQIDKQRRELVDANTQIDHRRRFIETVLAEISSAILVISLNGKVKLFNDAAARLFAIKDNELIGKGYNLVLPEIKELLATAQNTDTKLAQDNIIIERFNKKMHLFVQIAKEINNSQQIESFVVTCDDISALVAAQRAAAWADVARRVAHEIKNPLTPIRLSAERLLSKYTKQINEQQENFRKYINNIIRHTEDIGKIVEEFVNFARIPSPKFAKCDLVEIINEVVFSQRAVFRDIDYQISIPQPQIQIWADRRQICQILLNLLKNAAEAIELIEDMQKEKAIYISVQINWDKQQATIHIQDTGIGFSPELLGIATEPYVTNKPQGTGLGLAIVKKIIEDHGSELRLANNQTHRGAMVEFSLPLYTYSN
jgi:two-component system nitrogen regulation sensor histidine kinase NtrY